MANDPQLSAQERAGKSLSGIVGSVSQGLPGADLAVERSGPFHAVVAITRGGLVPAAIVARELGVR